MNLSLIIWQIFLVAEAQNSFWLFFFLKELLYYILSNVWSEGLLIALSKQQTTTEVGNSFSHRLWQPEAAKQLRIMVPSPSYYMVEILLFAVVCVCHKLGFISQRNIVPMSTNSLKPCTRICIILTSSNNPSKHFAVVPFFPSVLCPWSHLKWEPTTREECHGAKLLQFLGKRLPWLLWTNIMQINNYRL